VQLAEAPSRKANAAICPSPPVSFVTFVRISVMIAGFVIIVIIIIVVVTVKLIFSSLGILIAGRIAAG